MSYYRCMKRKLGSLPQIRQSGMIAWLDGRIHQSYSGTGNTGNDLSGNNNNFTLGSGVVFNNTNKTFVLNQAIITTNILAALFNDGEASIVLYIKLHNATPTESAETGFVGYGAAAGNNRGHYPYVNGITYMDTFRATIVNGIQLSTSIARDQLHQVTITSKKNGNWKLYQNSFLIKTIEAENTITFLNQFLGKSSSKDTSNNTYYLKGELASCIIYNKEIQPSDISTILNYNANI